MRESIFILVMILAWSDCGRVLEILTLPQKLRARFGWISLQVRADLRWWFKRLIYTSGFV